MNNLDKSYQNLLQDILDNGVEKLTRNGKTLSVFGRTIRHKMSEGFPLLTTKKMAFKSIAVELLWFLKGDTNIRYLVQNDCNIWNGDAYKKYLDFVNDEWNRGHITELELFGLVVETHYDAENGARRRKLTQEEFIEKIKTNPVFAGDWGDLGKIYGAQWRRWNKEIDQIENLIEELKINPDSRRLMVSAWNVGELNKMTLPPCHYSFQVYTRELSLEEREDYFVKNILGRSFIRAEGYKVLDEYNTPKRAISLMFNMRSNDAPLGLPFNIASYALLLKIIAEEVNMIPDELIGSLADTHIYENQIEGVKEQITRTSFDLPDIEFSEEFNAIMNDSTLTFSEKIEKFEPSMFKLKNYTSHSRINLPLSN